MWIIDKTFNFCYGHRVWTQELKEEFSLDSNCKCRHLHGHEALVKVYLEGELNNQGMVTDFKHLNWLKLFLDTYLDHKFIIDVFDPNFEKIVNYKIDLADPMIGWWSLLDHNKKNELHVKECKISNSSHEVYGYLFDTSSCNLSPLETEFYESFFMVDFVPTSENLAKWVYNIVKHRMETLGVKVAQVDWNETPKSKATYMED